MSEEIKTDKTFKKLSKHFRDQIKLAEDTIVEARRQIQEAQNRIQRELAVIGYAQHILDTFELPDKIEEPKQEKKTELEVK